MLSTISSAGWPAASMARRTAAMLLVTPVEVSLCTTHTALIWCCAVGFQAGLDQVGLHPAAPAQRHAFFGAWLGQKLGLHAQAGGHFLPQAGKVAGLEHQHLVAGLSTLVRAASQAPVPDAG
jgi:hypothetical protein